MGLSDTVFGATNLKSGADADKPVNPKPGDIYVATDNNILYVCYASGIWSQVPHNRRMPSSTDVNDLVDSGFYRLSTIVNGPAQFSGDYGQLVVSHGGGDTILQILGDHRGNLAFRNGAPPEVGGGGSWSAWKQILTDIPILTDDRTQVRPIYTLTSDILATISNQVSLDGGVWKLQGTFNIPETFLFSNFSESGTMRFTCEFTDNHDSASADDRLFVELRVNGSVVSEKSTGENTSSFGTWTFDIPVSCGDVVELYGMGNYVNSWIDNFTVRGAFVSPIATPTFT